MLKMLRVDFRLIHGQTGVYWTAKLGCDCILVASDALLNDPIKLATVKMSKPSGAKLVIKNIDDSIKAIQSGVTDKYQLFILTDKLEYAVRLIDACGFERLNLGGIMPTSEAKKLNDAVYCTPEEIDQIRYLIDKNCYVYLQQVPSDEEVDVRSVI
ncbi:PTS mannose/fructose/sorbose transporter subunit IIB [bacterium 1XD21-13]|nr:PTS mannose/fructose/sorbose transporter subunit IIB [bacterium 1XD21-13]